MPDSAVAQVRRLREGAATSRDLVETALERAAQAQPRLGAFARLWPEQALRDAEGEHPGPLYGLPVAVKDNFDVAGQTTGHGTANPLPPARADAEVVRRLRAAGGVVIGHTAMAELALYAHTSGKAVRNPHDTSRSPGGSSGGSAVAVAAGIVTAAMGTDGGASIRVPAAACGLFGIKPHRDRVPMDPDRDHWHGLTHAGPLTRTAADAALILDVVADRAPDEPLFSDAVAHPPSRLRIGVTFDQMLRTRLDPSIRAAVDEVAKALLELGHDVRPHRIDFPELRPYVVPRYLHGAFLDASRFATLDDTLRSTRGLARLGRFAGALAERGMSPTDDGAVARIVGTFDDIDVLLSPTIAEPIPAPDHMSGRGGLRTFDGMRPWVTYTAPWNFTGQPACSLPWGTGDDGLPRAVQLVARPRGEATILALAAQLESVPH